MKNIFIVLLLVVLLLAGFWYFGIQGGQPPAVSLPQVNLPITTQTPKDTEAIKVIATNLDTPWGIAFLPDGNMLATERKGTVRLIKDGQLQQTPVAIISSAREIGEGGLLGVAIDPDFATNNFVYLYYTYQ